MPLTEEIAALQIGIDELIALKVGINKAVRHYNLPPLAATLRLIDDIKNIIQFTDSKGSYLHYTCRNIHLTKPAHVKANLLFI
ncbi:MAG: hypothetical protein ACJ71G_04055 [Nitrososphaeraceae archaeon]